MKDASKRVTFRVLSKRLAPIAAVIGAVALFLGNVEDIARVIGSAISWRSQRGAVSPAMQRVRHARTGIPIDSQHLSMLQSTQKQLQTGLSMDLGKLISAHNAPWSTAQTVVAIATAGPVNVDLLYNALNMMIDSTCSCYRENLGSIYPPHVPATAWAILGYSKLNRRPPDVLVSFVLRSQNPEGWWPVFPTANRRYAATAATAWAVLALQSIQKAGLVPPILRDSVANAIAAGHRWLTANRIPSSARWADYPNLRARPSSLSLSGLALHALHQQSDSGLAEIDRRWVQELPIEVPDAGFCEQAAVWVDTPSGDQRDFFCQLVVPWMLIATVDVYPKLNATSRAAALVWIERTLDESKLADSEVMEDDWKRAELAFSVNVLLSSADTTK